MTIEHILSLAGDLITIIGLPIGLLGLWLSSRTAAKSRDVQVVLNMIESFQHRWDQSWAATLRRVEALRTNSDMEPLPEDVEDDFRSLLNWIDWLGSLQKSRLLNRPDAILESLSPPISRALTAGAPLIRNDEETHGPKFWSGLRHLEKQIRA